MTKPLCAILAAALLFGSALQAAPACAAVEDCGDFTVILPEGWEYGFRRGVHLLRDGAGHSIDIIVEEGRNEPLADIAGEHGLPVRILGEAAGGRGEASRFLAAKGDAGVYIEIGVDDALLARAPEVIRSMKAGRGMPGLQAALRRISSDRALDCLR
ncbi:MAG: hypothetical protein MJ061_05400 [Mailhella sp.]|nr:hypothetical protein [Mailhella sp.]